MDVDISASIVTVRMSTDESLMTGKILLSYTQEVPVLREEYDNYALVQFIPLSVWNKISGQIGNTEEDTYIRILAEDGITLTELNALEADILQVVGGKYTIESENRIREKETDDTMKKGFPMQNL